VLQFWLFKITGNGWELKLIFLLKINRVSRIVDKVVRVHEDIFKESISCHQ